MLFWNEQSTNTQTIDISEIKMTNEYNSNCPFEKDVDEDLIKLDDLEELISNTVTCY
jgi:hypothetical protein